MQDGPGRRSHPFLGEEDEEKSQSGQERKAGPGQEGSCCYQLPLYLQLQEVSSTDAEPCLSDLS